MQKSVRSMIFRLVLLRYYERIGLIPPVPRNASGIRDYDEESCGWIQLMKCMRKAGVQIEALIEYVALFRRGDSTVRQEKKFCWNSVSDFLNVWKICKNLWIV